MTWCANAQPVGALWARTYGGVGYGSFERIKQTADGGYIIGGNIGSADRGTEFWIMKVNPAGIFEWSRYFGTDSTDYLQDLIVLDDGYVLAGISEGYPPAEQAALLIRLDANGDSLTSFYLNDYLINHFHRVVKTLDGGVFAVGDVTNDPNADTDWLLLGAKLDTSLDSAWSHTYMEGYNCWGYVAIATTDGGYALGCNPEGYAGLLRVNDHGAQGWYNNQVGQPNTVVELPDGGFAGLVSSSTHATMRIVDADGVQQDILGFDYGYHNDGAVPPYVHMQRFKDAGFVFPVDPEQWTGQPGRFALARLDSGGDSLWMSDVLAPDWSTAIYDMIETRDGGFVFCGSGSAGGGNSINWILRTTPDGSLIVTHSMTVIREGDGVRLRWSVNPELTEVIEGYRVYCTTDPNVPYQRYLGFVTDTTMLHGSALAESDFFYYFVVSKYGFATARANEPEQAARNKVQPSVSTDAAFRVPYYGHKMDSRIRN